MDVAPSAVTKNGTIIGTYTTMGLAAYIVSGCQLGITRNGVLLNNLLSILSIDTWGGNPIFHLLPDEANFSYGTQLSKVKVTCKSSLRKKIPTGGGSFFFGGTPEGGGGGTKKIVRIFFHPPPCFWSLYVRRGGPGMWPQRPQVVPKVRTVLGNYTPQMDPHRKAPDSNIGTKKTAGKWASHQSLVVRIESG